MSWLVIAMQVGMWFGYVSFGFIEDAIGRKLTYVIYVLAAAVLLPMYGFLRVPVLLLLLGPFVAFFGTGYFSGLGALVAELYPTSVRAAASRAPPRPIPSDRSQRHGASASPSRLPAPHSCSQRSCGFGFQRHAIES